MVPWSSDIFLTISSPFVGNLVKAQQPAESFSGASGQDQRLLVHFELVMSERSVPGLTKPLDKVSDEVSDKRRQKATAKCLNPRRLVATLESPFLSAQLDVQASARFKWIRAANGLEPISYA